MFTSLHGETSRQFSELKVPESLRTLSQSSQRHDLKPNKPFSNGVYDVYTRKETDTTILIASTLSVHGLFSSYLPPLVSDGLLRKLNDLFALIPSEEGTETDEELKGEREEMTRLAEAVKFVGIGAS